MACHAFEAPTPANAAFAARIDAMLGGHHHHMRNLNDVVTHAWQVDELEQIPDLYAPRRTVLEALIPVITAKVKPIDYCHARAGVTTFESSTGSARSRPSSSTSTSTRTSPSWACWATRSARGPSSSEASPFPFRGGSATLPTPSWRHSLSPGSGARHLARGGYDEDSRS